MGEPFVDLPRRLRLRRDWIFDPVPEWFRNRLDDDRLEVIATMQLELARRAARAELDLIQAELEMLDRVEVELLKAPQK